VYARRVDGQVLTLAVSGMLWNRSLVMMDTQTKTLWSHLLGKAMQGPLKGKYLETILSKMTDWSTWKKLHPDTTVVNLRRTSRNYRRAFYRAPAAFVLGIAGGDKPHAWSFAQLIEHPVLNDTFDKTPIVILFESESKTASVYDRRVDGKTLTFKNEADRLIDQETGSEWNRLSGTAIRGTLEGTALKAIPAIVSYATAWMTFHPDTVGLPDSVARQAKAAARAGGMPSAADITKRIMENDKNTDGKVTADELPEPMKRILSVADTNRDGAIDDAEAKAFAHRITRGRRP